ncbi:MAG: hypothetical protein ACKOGD_06490 [Sphingomonadales bacterium]
MKKVIAICCFAALLLSTSSLSYFYWLQEKVHEQERFANIDAGKFEKNDDNDNKDQITLIVQDKSVLPKGYHWEEKGREFSYKGMFYDIVSIKKTKEGWVIKAASDEEEAAIVANQYKVHSFNKDPKSKTSSESSKIKLNLSITFYDCNQFFDYKFSTIILDKKGYFIYTTPILNTYLGEITHPPEAV